MALTKKDWVLLLLMQTPLDRIHIMKALFLIWHRSGRKISNYFEFEPYLYGPCSFEVYSVLESLETSRFIVQLPHLIPQWVDYYLTEQGKKEAEEAIKRAPADTVSLIKTVATEVSKLGFFELLRKVYAEAPDFAAKSMFKGVA